MSKKLKTFTFIPSFLILIIAGSLISCKMSLFSKVEVKAAPNIYAPLGEKTLEIKEFVSLEKMFLSYYFSAEQRLQRILTMSKMTDLGLQIEQFRRKHGRLPETLDELGIPLPVDALSGEPIRFTRFARVFREECNGHAVSRDLPGWQLSAPGRNHERVPEERKESLRDFFTVITQWPVPAPPEPPKNNEGSFDFMGSAGANEEAAP